MDTNDIKTYLKTPGLDNSKNIFSYIIRSTEKYLQPPLVKVIFWTFGTPKLSLYIKAHPVMSCGRRHSMKPENWVLHVLPKVNYFKKTSVESSHDRVNITEYT